MYIQTTVCIFAIDNARRLHARHATSQTCTIKDSSLMKKTFIAIVAALLGAQTMSAQTVEESNTLDNWYLGVNVGMSAKTTHTSVFKHLNPSAGVRVGRYLTPVFGFAVEGELYFNNKGSEYRHLGTFVKGLNLSLLGTTNFSNWIGGYPGTPRLFEIVGIYGFGWGKAFSAGEFPGDDDVFSSKLGIDFTFNLGSAKAWQVYIEPNITYGLDYGSGVKYNVNNSCFGVLVGANYKFGNSNGTHNFKIAELRDQAEIDALNAKINQLREDNNAKDGALANKDRDIARLRAELDECRKKPAQPVVVNENKNVLQPTVVFAQGKSTIDQAQYANVAMVAKYMKNHPESKVLIKGYASPEGSAELNQALSEKRAENVKAALVKKYKIDESRLTTQGMGETDKLFEEVDFNRVCTFTDTTKK